MGAEEGRSLSGQAGNPAHSGRKQGLPGKGKKSNGHRGAASGLSQSPDF